MKKEFQGIPTQEGTTTKTIHDSKTFPFVIVEETKSNDDKEETNFMIGLAGQLICEKKFKTMKSAEMYISRKPWDLIMGFVCTTIELMKKDNEESK